MSPDLLQRAKRIFLETSGLPEDEREKFVDAAAGGNAELADEVRSLLRYAAGPAAFSPDAESLREAIAGGARPGDTLLGRVIKGRYRLVRRIGASSMSLVYEAEQANPRRSVAIKVLSFPDQSGVLVSRIQHEAQLLAELQHPGITQVYEFGFFHDGSLRRPFIAMEFVRGATTLTAYADANSLSVRSRLELFARVCDAVHHAHQKPIIHRDLKPGNILVDSTGATKVIDFGVARATNADLALTTMHTSPGQLIGTLQYMSPEQCAADPRQIDVRSDVYSLGVVLFELLCARPPYDLRDLPIATAAQIVQRCVPPRLSRVRRDLRGDLETIVGKALEKDREARYQSVLDLLEDLRRLLARRPIRSRRPGPWTRFRAWVGDHPLLTTMAIGALIVLTSVGLALGSVYLLALKPARLVLDVPHRSASLVSRTGHDLHNWELAASTELGGAHALLAQRAPALGGGQIALIAGTLQAPNDVAAFDIRDPDRPIWTTGSDRIEYPAGERGHPEAVMAPILMRVADYVPNLPGDEVLVIHQLCKFSATVIRVFDLTGRVRYQAWHDGWIAEAVWLPREGLLVLGGVNSEHIWHARRLSAPQAKGYPSAVFALRIEDGRLMHQWVVKDGRKLDSTIAWYKWLGPAEALDAIQDGFALPQPWVGQPGPESRVTINFGILGLRPNDPASGRLAISVDAHGNEVSRYTDEVYQLRVRSGEFPLDSALRLCDYDALPLLGPNDVSPGPPSSDPGAAH